MPKPDDKHTPLRFRCERRDSHADGQAREWQVWAKPHDAARDGSGRSTTDEGSYAVATALEGQTVVLAQYAKCPHCGEPGHAINWDGTPYPDTVFVV
jgi:hypothetical protein